MGPRSSRAASRSVRASATTSRTRGASFPKFEALTLGTLGVVLLIALVGYVPGAPVRRRTVDVPLEVDEDPCARRSRAVTAPDDQRSGRDRPRPPSGADRARERRLDERTQASSAMYERARRTLSGGVASSYQVRDPWPIYLSHGAGQRVWDVDGNELLRLPQRLRLDGAGTCAPGDHAARVEERRGAGNPLRSADGGRDRRRRGARAGASGCRTGATPTPAPRRRWTRSGSRAAHTGRDTIVKIFGSYHGHHDARDGLDRRRVRPDRRPREPRRRSRTAPASRRPSSTSPSPCRSTTPTRWSAGSSGSPPRGGCPRA